MTYPNFKDKCFEKALFSPSDFVSWTLINDKGIKNKPLNYIIVYYPYLLNYFKRKYKPKEIKVTRAITLYIYKNLALVQMLGVGSPNAAMVLEELIALGGKRFLNIGSCGGLIDFGVFLCDKALRDEGTSHHYLPKGKFMYPDEQLTKKFKKYLEKHSVDFDFGSTWTIDTPYRETIAEINHYKKQGISTVEMEASALFAVATFRKVKIASCFVVSDMIMEDKYDPQFDAKHVQQKLKHLIDVAVDLYLSYK